MPRRIDAFVSQLFTYWSRGDVRTRPSSGSTRSETRREHRSELVYWRQLPSYRTSSTVVRRTIEPRSLTYRTKQPT